MSREVVYTGDIFRHQAHGGITRCFTELASRLRRPWVVVAGLHQSVALAALGPRVRAGLRMRHFRGAPQLRGLVNHALDAALLAGRRDAILHPTYYRDPAGLPRGVPLVATVFDMAHERLPEHFRPRRWRAPDPATHKAAMCARADRVVCISEATRRDLEALLGVPSEKVRTIHPGATDWRGVTSQPIARIERPFVLWVGERHSYKNFARALDAWATTYEAAGTDLLCVGAGPFRPEERGRIASHGAGARVHQHQAAEGELRWAYEHAEALLYGSLWEGFGLPPVEAMSLGCPVIVADRSSLPEVCGEVAIYVDPTDVDSLRDGIRRALAAGRTPAGGDRLRARAARFSWDANATAHEALYRELDA